MAGKIEAKVVPNSFVLAAGDTVEATATLRNLGQSVDQLTLGIEGLQPTWYTLPVSSVALFPNDQDNLRIVLHPPKTAETKAGLSQFHIRVTSQQNPEEITTLDLTIEIRALPGVELDISPKRVVGRKGIYRVVVNNKGDSDTTLHLKARDATGGLRYYLRPERLTVPGGGRAEAALEVRLRWSAFLGGEKEFNFQVSAAPAEAGRLTEEVAPEPEIAAPAEAHRLAEEVAPEPQTASPGRRRQEAVPGKGLDYIEELKAIAKLRDEGILTQEEFEEKKAKILKDSM
jgi:hypothetical protein